MRKRREGHKPGAFGESPPVGLENPSQEWPQHAHQSGLSMRTREEPSFPTSVGLANRVEMETQWEWAETFTRAVKSLKNEQSRAISTKGRLPGLWKALWGSLTILYILQNSH